MSTSVIFDLFGISEGRQLCIICRSLQFYCRFPVPVATYGLFTKKNVGNKITFNYNIILVVSFVGLLIHANTGGIYEQKTIKAMLSRIALTGAFAGISWFFITKNKIVKNMPSV